MLDRIKSFGWGYLAIGIALIGIGVSFVVFRDALTMLAIAIGITLALYGILSGIIALSEKERSLKFAFKLTISILCVVGGIVTLVLRKEAIEIITDICCLLLIIDGAFKLKSAIMSRRIGAFAWWVMIILSLVTIIPSFVVTKLLTASPDSAVLSVVIGIIILIDGVANILLPFLPKAEEENRGDSKPGSLDKSHKDNCTETAEISER